MANTPNVRSGSPIKPDKAGKADSAATKRLVVHNKREPFDVYIGRPSKWGNPFSHKDGTQATWKVESRDAAVDAYEAWIQTQPELLADLHELRGRVLGCWCAPQRCHGDVLASLANAVVDHPDYVFLEGE